MAHGNVRQKLTLSARPCTSIETVLPVFMGVTAVATLSFSLITTAFDLAAIFTSSHDFMTHRR